MIELNATPFVIIDAQNESFDKRVKRFLNPHWHNDPELVDIYKPEDCFVAIVYGEIPQPEGGSACWNYFIVQRGDIVRSAQIKTPSARVGKDKEILQVNVQEKLARIYLETVHDANTVVTVSLEQPFSHTSFDW